MHPSFRRRELAPLLVRRAHAAAVGLADGRVAVLGGGTRGGEEVATGACEVRCLSSGAVEIVDVERDVITPGPMLRGARESARAARLGERILVMSGIADHG